MSLVLTELHTNRQTDERSDRSLKPGLASLRYQFHQGYKLNRELNSVLFSTGHCYSWRPRREPLVPPATTQTFVHVIEGSTMTIYWIIDLLTVVLRSCGRAAGSAVRNDSATVSHTAHSPAATDWRCGEPSRHQEAITVMRTFITN